MDNNAIGSLWVNKEKGYTSGEIDGKKVIIFKNKFKTEEKQPDYKVYLRTPKGPKEEPKEVTSDINSMEVVQEESSLPF